MYSEVVCKSAFELQIAGMITLVEAALQAMIVQSHGHVEAIVNSKPKSDVLVTMEQMSLASASNGGY